MFYDIKVYVGCALTHAPQEFRESVEKLKDRLKGICQVLSFKGLSDDHIPYDVYSHDIYDCVKQCDILIAICDYPSIGLGWEMATQIEHRAKPLLAVAHKDALITKLIIDPQLPGYEFRRYDDLEDVYDMVRARLETMSIVA